MYQTNTKSLLTASGVEVGDILAGRPMPHFTIPELNELLSPIPVRHYPYNKTFDEAASDDVFILHSSGSTGRPKPLSFNHASLATLDNHVGLPEIDEATGRRYQRLESIGLGVRIFCPFMHFHAICSAIMPVMTVFGGAIYVPGFRNRSATKADMFNILDHAHVQDAFLSPSLMEEIASQPQAAHYFSKLRIVHFGGAVLQQTTGDLAARHTLLRNQWGITENLHCLCYATDPEDYNYSAFDLVKSGLRFEPIPNNPGLSSMHIDLTPTSVKHAPFFGNQPGAKTFDVGDIWEAHPDPAKAPFTFRFAGRSDDLISFKDGVNFHPT